MTMRAAPIASGAITPDAAGITVHPMVRTRKKVPINSAMYFLILVSWMMKECVQIDSAKLCIGIEWGGEVIFPLGESGRHSTFACRAVGRRRRGLRHSAAPMATA